MWRYLGQGSTAMRQKYTYYYLFLVYTIRIILYKNSYLQLFLLSLCFHVAFGKKKLLLLSPLEFQTALEGVIIPTLYFFDLVYMSDYGSWQHPGS